MEVVFCMFEYLDEFVVIESQKLQVGALVQLKNTLKFSDTSPRGEAETVGKDKRTFKTGVFRSLQIHMRLLHLHTNILSRMLHLVDNRSVQSGSQLCKQTAHLFLEALVNMHR